jgi:hypothetical protein
MLYSFHYDEIEELVDHHPDAHIARERVWGGVWDALDFVHTPSYAGPIWAGRKLRFVKA